MSACNVEDLQRRGRLGAAGRRYCRSCSFFLGVWNLGILLLFLPATLGSDWRTRCGSTITRYDVYQYELAMNYQGDFSSDTTVSRRETGAPQCTGPTPIANRRLLNVAIVNCRSSPVTIQSNAQNVPVAGFGSFFLTHAVTNQTRPYAEFRGLLERGAGVIYDQVQLFR